MNVHYIPNAPRKIIVLTAKDNLRISKNKVWISKIALWISNIVTAFRGMHMSPAKHSYAWLSRKCDYRTDRHTHAQTEAGQSDPYVPLCFAGDTKIALWISKIILRLPKSIFEFQRFFYECIKIMFKLQRKSLKFEEFSLKFKYYYLNFRNSSLNFRVHWLNFKIRHLNFKLDFFLISKNILNNKVWI